MVDPQRNVLQRSLLPGWLGVEERQLPPAGIGAHEGEPVGLLDDVHAEMRGDEIGDAVPVTEPKRDMVESLRTHGSRER